MNELENPIQIKLFDEVYFCLLCVREILVKILIRQELFDIRTLV